MRCAAQMVSYSQKILNLILSLDTGSMLVSNISKSGSHLPKIVTKKKKKQ